jgi:anti-sigma B factor antagonist
MPLSLDCRHCGQVYVIRCSGAIVTGEEASVLEAAIQRSLREFLRFVLDVGNVSRVDSTGLGLLVRFLSHTRNRGGDLRLAAPQPFMVNLLRLTKLSTIFRVYPSEEEAIVSFLKEPRSERPEAADVSPGPLVLFVDQSPDLCAFVRSLLLHHGYQVLSACLVSDARTLLSATNIDYVILGPNSSQRPSDSVAASLKSLAPQARTLQLESGFKLADPEQAGNQLLEMMRGRAAQA